MYHSPPTSRSVRPPSGIPALLGWFLTALIGLSLLSVRIDETTDHCTLGPNRPAVPAVGTYSTIEVGMPIPALQIQRKRQACGAFRIIRVTWHWPGVMGALVLAGVVGSGLSTAMARRARR